MSLCILCPVLRASRPPRRPLVPPACDGCRERLAEDLAAIPDAYARLPAALELGRGGGPKVSGSREAPIPVRIDVLSLLAGGSDHLAGRVFAEDQVGALPPAITLDLWVRDWTDQRAQHEHPPPPYVADLAGWLSDRLDWAITNHPAVDEFAREVHDTLRTIRGVVDQQGGADSVGACPQRLGDGQRCGARLRADPYVDQIACPRCGTTWDRRRQQWLALAAAQEDARREQETIDAA